MTAALVDGMVFVAPQTRVWNHAGVAATVVAVTLAGVEALADSDRRPRLLNLGEWRLAWPCERCDRAAEVWLPASGRTDELLCRACAEAGTPSANWAEPIRQCVIGALYPHCTRLG